MGGGCPQGAVLRVEARRGQAAFLPPAHPTVRHRTRRRRRLASRRRLSPRHHPSALEGAGPAATSRPGRRSGPCIWCQRNRLRVLYHLAHVRKCNCPLLCTIPVGSIYIMYACTFDWPVFAAYSLHHCFAAESRCFCFVPSSKLFVLFAVVLTK